MRWPGVEPGSTAWKATMLTVTPPTPADCKRSQRPFCHYSYKAVVVITTCGVNVSMASVC